PLHRQLHSSRLPQATPPSPTRRSSDLADPTRRKVFERLRSGPKPVGRIARGLPVSRPAVSQHLKVLKEAGLVTDRPEGTRRVYRSEEHTSELQSRVDLVCRLLLEKKNY